MKKRALVCLLLLAAAVQAQDKKISDLTSGSPVQATDMIPIARGGANFRLAGNDFLMWSSGTGDVPATGALGTFYYETDVNDVYTYPSTDTETWLLSLPAASGVSGGIPYFSNATDGLASSLALTANLPVIGGGAGAAPSVGTRSGNTTAYVTTTGTQTSGDCVKIDASGNHIANGSACGGGSSLGFFWGMNPQGDTVNASSTEYAGINTYTFNGDYDRKWISPAACTARNLRVDAGAQPSTGSLVITLRVANADTALTITHAASAGAALISDLANTASVAAGDPVNLKFVNNASAITAAVGYWSLQCN